ncbi:MAG: hypothetical protein ACOYMV_08370 [Verrucomicrobiia bacterium]|jgi:hypothetical protein
MGVIVRTGRRDYNPSSPRTMTRLISISIDFDLLTAHRLLLTGE